MAKIVLKVDWNENIWWLDDMEQKLNEYHAENWDWVWVFFDVVVEGNRNRKIIDT